VYLNRNSKKTDPIRIDKNFATGTF